MLSDFIDKRMLILRKISHKKFDFLHLHLADAFIQSKLR